jgi:multidrug resistance efflux pump
MRRYSYFPLAITLLALVSCTGQTTPSGESTESAETSPTTIEATGIVVPETWAVVSFSTGGRIVDLPLSAGDKVERGSTLARLDDEDVRRAADIARVKASEAEVNVSVAQHELDRVVTWSPNKNQVAAAESAVANAEAAVSQAQSNYDRVAWEPHVSGMPQSLQLQQATNSYNQAKSNLDYLYSNRPDVKRAADQLDLSKLSLQEAQLNLQAAQAALDKMVVNAPFDGTINRVYVHEEEVVGAGTPIMIIGDLSTLRIETTDLNENDVVSIAIGDKVMVTFEALPGVEIEGTVTEMGTRAEEGVGVNFTVTVEVDEMPEVIRWGMTAYVSFPSKH